MPTGSVFISSVQVMLFADRLEVWDPGQLPPPLTLEQLRGPHASIPRNPLICEPMFLPVTRKRPAAAFSSYRRLPQVAILSISVVWEFLPRWDVLARVRIMC